MPPKSQQKLSDLYTLKIVSDLMTMHKALLAKIDKLENDIDSKIGPKGEDGHTPDKEELLELIEPLIPVLPELEDSQDGKDGENGEDYVLTDEDKQEIASLIEVPVIEKIVERTEVIKEQPITKIIETIDKEEVKEVVKELLDKMPKKETDAFDEVVGHKTKKLYPKHITGLEQTLHAFDTQLKSRGGYLHGGGVPSLQAGSNITLTKTSDGGFIVTSTAGNPHTLTEKVTAVQSGSDITLDLTTLAHTPTAIMFVTRQGQILTPTTDWSRVGDTITVLNADSSEIFLVTYLYA